MVTYLEAGAQPGTVWSVCLCMKPGVNGYDSAVIPARGRIKRIRSPKLASATHGILGQPALPKTVSKYIHGNNQMISTRLPKM